jgi:hypothetical protein
MQEKTVVMRWPAAMDKRRNQPPDSSQLKRQRKNLPQAEAWQQMWDWQQR